MSGLFSYLAKPISILFGGTGGATKAAAQSSLDIQVATGSIDGISRGVGIVGEFSSASVASSAVSLTSGVTANLTSVSLPAGKYLVFGCVTFAPAATTSVTHLGVGSSQVSASLGVIGDNSLEEFMAAVVPGAVVLSKQIPVRWVDISAAATLYLVGDAIFSVSTMTAGGKINWVRVS